VDERPDFNLRGYWRDARKYLDLFQHFTLKLRVSPSIRHNLKGDYTLVREEADGSVVVRVELASFDDAVSYALGLGADATVLWPNQVRTAVANTAIAIASMYG
jgi:predicted DNA-binding transcriptional regulator YafY